MVSPRVVGLIGFHPVGWGRATLWKVDLRTQTSLGGICTTEILVRTFVSYLYRLRFYSIFCILFV